MKQDNHNKIPPRGKADCLSILCIWWLRKLLRLGWKRKLTEDDIYPALYSDYSVVQGSKLERNWFKHLAKCSRTKSAPSFRWIVLRTFGPKFLFYGMFTMLEECVFRMIQVVCMGFFIDYFSDERHKITSRTTAFFAGGGLIMSSVCFLISHHWSMFSTHHVCTHMRLAVSALIYRKVLKLSQATMRSFSVGQLVTLFSSDVHRFDMQDLHLNYLWVAPLQLSIVIFMLYFHYDYGISSLGGLLLLVVFIIFQIIMSKYIATVRLHKIVATNRRIKIITEIMEAFYSIKLYAWESLFFIVCRDSRYAELRYLKNTMIFRILNTSLSLVLTKMTVFLTLLFYIYYDDRPLDAGRVFITLVLYEHVRVNLAFLFTHAATDFAEISVTLTRLTEFLLLEEKYVDPKYYEAATIDSKLSTESPSPNRISLSNLTCKWHPHQDLPTLEGINLELEEGKFLAIVGPIGSGKTSLLSAILGELPVVEGKVQILGNISYVSQTPWLFPGTIRQNITFGKMYNPTWYKEVIEICGLQTDFQSMESNDSTTVSNAGLSSGQKARISMARAVYSNSDIYLMDDPLNSVDVRQSRHILETCIRGALKNKAVLLVTHQIHFLEAADDIAVLMNGKCRAHGTYSELKDAGIKFSRETEDIVEEEEDEEEEYTTEYTESGIRIKSIMIVEEEEETHRLKITELTPAAQEVSRLALIGKSTLAVKDIEASDEKYDKIGPEKIGFGLFWSYIKSSSSWPLIICLIILCILVQVIFSGSDYWLEFWTHEEEKRKLKKGPGLKTDNTGIHNSELQVIVYCSLIPGLVLVAVLRSIVMFRICIKASLRIFCQMLKTLLNEKPRFIESNCVGQGINRFSKDLIVIDELLPTTLYEMTGVFFEILGAALILSYINQWFLIPCIMYLTMVFILYQVYHTTATKLKRIEANARSPIYAHITKTLQGLSTIRAYEQEQVFLKIFDDLQDKHTGAWYLYIATHSWLSVSVDWVSILLISAVTITFLYMDHAKSTEVGLAIAKVIELSILMQIGVTECADSETEMISVERILEYNNEETEIIWDSPSTPPPDDWPQSGHITFDHIYLEGFNKKIILRDVNCEILPGEKIGVVGRSGAGKSTLVNALFRIVESTNGTIEIDGINIQNLGLHDLRKKISVIPQNPYVFAGTLRMNLDPFDKHTDQEIWEALEEANLYDTIKSIGGGLDTQFSENGWQLSAGQRQLLCLARAMLENNKILCCDEATANLDPQTQSIMLKKIKEHFIKCTVITVAHRIHTIIDCDKVIVMEDGHIVDYGPPYELLNHSGPFQSLVVHMGRKNAEEITRLAKDAHLRKYTRRKTRGMSLIESTLPIKTFTSSTDTTPTIAPPPDDDNDLKND